MAESRSLGLGGEPPVVRREWCLGVKLAGTRGIFSRGGQVGSMVWMTTGPGGTLGVLCHGGSL